MTPGTAVRPVCGFNMSESSLPAADCVCNGRCTEQWICPRQTRDVKRALANPWVMGAQMLTFGSEQAQTDSINLHACTTPHDKP